MTPNTTIKVPKEIRDRMQDFRLPRESYWQTYLRVIQLGIEQIELQEGKNVN